MLFWLIYVNFRVDEWNQEHRTRYAKQASLVCKDALLINSLSGDPDAYGGCYYHHEGEICKSLEMKEEGLLIVAI